MIHAQAGYTKVIPRPGKCRRSRVTEHHLCSTATRSLGGGAVSQPTHCGRRSIVPGNRPADPPISLLRLLPRSVPAQLSGLAWGRASGSLPCNRCQTTRYSACSLWPMHQICSIRTGPCRSHWALDMFLRSDKLQQLSPGRRCDPGAPKVFRLPPAANGRLRYSMDVASGPRY